MSGKQGKRFKYAMEFIFGGFMIGGAMFLYLRPESKIEDQIRPEAALPVKVQRVQKAHWSETATVIGTAASYQSVRIASEVSEVLSEIHFKNGQEVRKGDLLFLLERREEEAKAENLAIVFADAKRELERYDLLKQAHAVSAKEYDAQKTKMEIAEMELKAMRLALEDRQICAPFSGTIGICTVNEGAYVKAGDELVSLNDDCKIKVDFRVPEKYTLQIKRGMRFTATGEAVRDQTFSGTVDSWDSQIDLDSRTLPVRGILDNPKRVLRAGMLLSVTLELAGYDALTIPEKAVIFSGALRYVFTVSDAGTAERKIVKLGRRGDNAVEVLAGLKDGELLVTEGILKVKDGGKVVYENEKGTQK